MRSIRAYLVSRVVGGAALVLAVAGAAAYWFVARSLEAQFDRNLVDRVHGLASLLFQQGEHVEFEFSEQLMPEYVRAELPDYFELRFENGALLERSESLRGGDLALPEGAALAPSHWTAPLPDGRLGRFVAQLVEVHHVDPEEGPDRPRAALLSIVVARGRGELVAAEREVLFGCAAACLALIAVIALLTWRTVKRGLAPAERLAGALDRIRVDRLPKNLDVGELPSELQPMARTADALIVRVDQALERERRTTADIAHELRNPISEVLTVSEVALRDERDVGGARRALASIRDVAWRMGGCVSTLLALARLDMGAQRFEPRRVDLAALVAELRRSLAREREFAETVEPGELVHGDPDVLRIVVSNLLGNALYYAPRDGRIGCRVEHARERWRFVVENDAPDLEPDDLRSLAEPFWRKDRARTDRNRSGLGLALSRALAERTEMRLDFELEQGVFRAVLSGRQASNDDARSIARETAAS